MPAPSGSNWKWQDNPAPPDSCVAVWLAFVSGQDADAGLLSPEEQSRAARFLFERDRRSFVFHHTTLRRILGSCLGIDPALVPLERSAKGKPILAEPYARLKFNMAHSGEAGLYAVGFGREIGVDIERVRPIREAEGIANRFFSPAERSLLDGTPESFFAVWTRKEALLKATGEGIFGMEAPVPEGWSVVDLPAIPGYAAALALKGDPLPVRTRRYP